MDRLSERLAEIEVELKLEQRIEKLERRIEKLEPSVRRYKIWSIVLVIIGVFVFMGMGFLTEASF